MSLPENFADKTMTSTCVVWVGACNTMGYGLIYIDGKAELAHRVAYEAARGSIPEGMVIDHLCRVRNCVKPDHLEAVTQRENIRRGRAAAALKPGDTCINGHAIETADDLYQRPSASSPECRQCRAISNKRGTGRVRQTAQRRATAVARDMERIKGRAS